MFTTFYRLGAEIRPTTVQRRLQKTLPERGSKGDATMRPPSPVNGTFEQDSVVSETLIRSTTTTTPPTVEPTMNRGHRTPWQTADDIITPTHGSPDARTVLVCLCFCVCLL
ncbi:hypothetical protein ZHAS_00014398 [Anopheles sinensis]|uniref:Uncharacterized protein n=1 Tax=Anopheles sinensis TaxID=74873 RepID=A0A084W857_ANOSI|nr:hypothetical protein ZHAS_00014398 [Anopheles sinensis]